MAVVNMVYGISFPLLALVLDQQGTSKTLIGLNTVIQAAAIFAVAPVAPQLMRRWNPARIMQWSAVLLALCILLAGSFRNVMFWFPLRFLMGAMTALLWICSESLINELVSEARRARIVGIYSAVGSAGFALGPLLLALTGSVGMLPFFATIAVILLAAVPLWWVRVSRTTAPDGPVEGALAVFKLAPVIMLGNLVYAASVESFITFFPLFGLSLGLSEAYSLSLMTVVAVGGMILIVPISWLADKVHRMGLMATCVGLSAAGFALMPLMVQQPIGLAIAFMFALGGAEGMIYALGVTLVGERFKNGSLAVATTLFTTCWGAGTILGPLISGWGMDRFGAHSLAWIAAAFFVLYFPLPLMSWLRSRNDDHVSGQRSG